MSEYVRQKVRDGDYDTKLPFPTRKDPSYQSARRAYDEDVARLQASFRADLEDEYDMTGHPKADALFGLAWQEGHAYGYAEVVGKYETFVELAR